VLGCVKPSREDPRHRHGTKLHRRSLKARLPKAIARFQDGLRCQPNAARDFHDILSILFLRGDGNLRSREAMMSSRVPVLRSNRHRSRWSVDSLVIAATLIQPCVRGGRPILRFEFAYRRTLLRRGPLSDPRSPSEKCEFEEPAAQSSPEDRVPLAKARSCLDTAWPQGALARVANGIATSYSKVTW
jgi:hypothetical protein